MKTLIDYITANPWIWLIVYEIAVRLIPTDSKYYSLLALVDRIFPNLKKGGGFHILILGLISFPLSAQNNGTFKTWYSTNVSDTTFAQTTRTNIQNSNGNTGGLYFDKTRNKWKIWVGTCSSCSVDSAWVDLPLFASSGISVTAPLVKTGNIISIPKATSLIDGYLFHTDWSTFNNKENILTFNDGLTRTSNTIKFGGTMLSNKTLTGAFGFGLTSSLSANTKFQVTALDNTTGTTAFKFENSALTNLLTSDATGQLSGQGITVTDLTGRSNLGFSQTQSDYATVIGNHAKAGANYAVSLGYYAGANSGTTGTSSTSLGAFANNTGNNIGLRAVALGFSSQSNDNFDIAIGSESIARGGETIGIGRLANTNSGTYGTSFIGIGDNVNTGSSGIGNYSIAMGEEANGSGVKSMALGFENVSSGTGSLALGYQVTNSVNNSLALGWNTVGTTPDILFTKSNGWNVNGFYGHVGYTLQSDSTLGAPRWAVSKASGSNSQIQYNDSGTFGASSNFTLDNSVPSVPVLTLKNSGAGNSEIITAGDNFTIHQLGGPAGISIGSGGGIVFATSGQLTTGNNFNIDIIGSGTGNVQLSSSGSGDIKLIGNSGGGTYIIVSGLPTTCSGAPTGALANVGGVLTICP